MNKAIFLALSFFCAVLTKAADDPMKISSQIKNVKVYRSGAEIMHTSSANLSSGSQELIIQGISNKIDLNSLNIHCAATVTILGVEFSTNHLVAPEASMRIKTLQDSADRVQKELEKINTLITTTAELLEVLKVNRDIKGSQSNLSVAELVRLMDYYETKSAHLHNQLAAHKEKQRQINTLATKIKQQIQEEEAKNTGKAGQLTLQLSVAAAGKQDFQISYITPNAFWTPYYDIRVENIQRPMKLVYRARISQSTGIDWKKVKLSLSSSLPSQWGNAPLLKQWFIGYINPVNVLNRGLAANSIQSFEPGAKLDEVVVVGYGTRSIARESEDETPIYIVNGAVMAEQDFKNINPSAILKSVTLGGAEASAMYGAKASHGAVVVTLKDGLEDYVSITDKELDVSFDIDLPYDVPTNGKEQTATLQEHLVPTLYKFYSVPKLDKDAYLLAEVSEWEKLNLLPGDANIIFEGTYVGKSFIDPTSTSDTLNLTLGRDKRVVIKKEKMADFSSVKFLGSNKLQKVTYEITLKNNKKDSVKMLLKDQFPLSSNKEIEVELMEASGASINPETGILTWKMELAPGETRKLRFAYTVRYPKDKKINSL